MEKDLCNEYFEWLCSLVGLDDLWNNKSYLKLLKYLHSRDFWYSIPLDSNRYEDGICLRYRFGDLLGYENYIIANTLDHKPCTVLEMMVALALRCEEHFEEEPFEGVKMCPWLFRRMIDSLGLLCEDDEHFDLKYVSGVIDVLLERKYRADGKGGLFTLGGTQKDLKKVEIWYQMCWYLSDTLFEK